jgi:hypothetical protein
MAKKNPINSIETTRIENSKNELARCVCVVQENARNFRRFSNKSR